MIIIVIISEKLEKLSHLPPDMSSQYFFFSKSFSVVGSSGY